MRNGRTSRKSERVVGDAGVLHSAGQIARPHSPSRNLLQCHVDRRYTCPTHFIGSLNLIAATQESPDAIPRARNADPPRETKNAPRIFSPKKVSSPGPY